MYVDKMFPSDVVEPGTEVERFLKILVMGPVVYAVVLIHDPENYIRRTMK